ncbi:hypothetical protein ET33_17695 [Paenibacillus tyrfis]|uniref:Uncharacterized protein n=1 Tax=Paenibacillus tyrfis TaxID=1501230 RepID=A0A081NXM0_9BACL|nr:hypothetical protein ET33_17695 [Paenibacillus tyrfis]
MKINCKIIYAYTLPWCHRRTTKTSVPKLEKFQALVYSSFSHMTKLQSAILAWANQDEQIAKRVKAIEQEPIMSLVYS